MEFVIHKLSEDLKYQNEVNRLHQEGWPEFMRKNEKADLYWERLMTVFSEFQILLCDDNENILAVGNSIPIFWDGTLEGLPSGWEGAFEKEALGYEKRIKPNALSALAIVVDPKFQGKGLSNIAIKAVKDTAKKNGLNDFIVPLRPSLKSRYPLIPIEKYIEWKNDDGLPFDPWLRTHYKVGGRILKIATKSMTIRGTIAEWEQWVKMKFPESGNYVVSGALTPIQIDYENNLGTYIEPNVWVKHDLKGIA
jgi:GNAT superfamily N-acetyltransferase